MVKAKNTFRNKAFHRFGISTITEVFAYYFLNFRCNPIPYQNSATKGLYIVDSKLGWA